MNSNILKRSVLTLLLPCAINAADANIVTFTDLAGFQSATGATNVSGELPFYGRVGNSVTIGDVTFSGGSLWVGYKVNTPWTNIAPGEHLAIDGSENFNIDFNAPVFSAGFEVIEPSNDVACYATCYDTTFGVTLKLNNATVDYFEFNPANDVSDFIGVWSSSSFDRLEIRDLTNTIDDEYFGQVYAADIAISEVPLPAAAWLFASSLFGLAGFRKKIIS